MNRLSSTLSINSLKFISKENFSKTTIRPFANVLFNQTTVNKSGLLDSGHVAVNLREKEFEGLAEHLKNPEHLRILSNLGKEIVEPFPGEGYAPVELSIGHQPDTEKRSTTSHTILTQIDGKDVEYVNRTWPGQSPLAFQKFVGSTQSVDIGELTDGHLKAMAKVVESDRFGFYSLRGEKDIDKGQLSAEDLKQFLTEGKPPKHAPNCVDFVKAVLLEWAKLENPSPKGTMHFEAQLADCKTTQDVAALAQARFGRDKNGFMEFRSEKDVEPHLRLDSKPLYSKFLKASGLSKEVFDKMCTELAQKGLIFGEVFEKEEQWGTTFFSGLGSLLRKCEPGEAVGAVCYHQDTYKGGITHVSLIAVSSSGEVAVCHHESITVDSTKRPISNLMPGTVGVPSNTYDTTALHERVGSKFETLPIMASYKVSGPPMVQFTKLNDFDALRKYNEQAAHEGYVQPLPYATDFNQHLLEKKGAYLNDLRIPESTQDSRFNEEPLRLPPGEYDKASAGGYTNNCAAYVLRCLLMAGCAALQQPVGRVGELSLSEVAEILLQAGLMPCTNPDVAEIMNKAGYKLVSGEGVVTDTGSFLGLSTHWSNDLTGVGYAADVPRTVNDKASVESAQKKKLEKLAKIIDINQKSFKI